MDDHGDELVGQGSSSSQSAEREEGSDRTSSKTGRNYASHFTSIYYPGAGIIRDVKKRAPYYLSDWTSGFNYRTLAGTLRIYFLNLIPALAYIQDMYDRTDGNYGVNEALLSTALGGRWLKGELDEGLEQCKGHASHAGLVLRRGRKARKNRKLLTIYGIPALFAR